MGAAALGDARLPDGVLHGTLQDRLVQMVAPALAREPIVVDARGDPARAHGQIGLMLRADILEMADEFGLDHPREHGDPVFVALAAADDDLIAGEVDVLDTEPATLEHPQPRPVQQASHEVRHALESLEHGADLIAREDDGQPRGALGAHDAIEPWQGDVQHVAVEEEEGAQRLVLRRRCSGGSTRRRPLRCGGCNAGRGAPAGPASRIQNVAAGAPPDDVGYANWRLDRRATMPILPRPAFVRGPRP